MKIQTAKINNQFQAGVSLLLSILILSSILAIAFSLATIIFVEIRAAGDAARTEPALYGAQTITEEAFMNYQNLAPANYAYDTTINGVSLNRPTVKNSPGSPFVDIVPPGYKKYEIVDRSNLYGAAHYGTLQVTYLGGSGSLAIQLTEYNPDPNSCSGGTAISSGSVSSGGSPFFTNLDSCLQYDLKLTNSGNSDITVRLDTTAKNDTSIADGQPKGLPYVGANVLEAVVSYRSLTRRYLVTIPLGSGATASTSSPSVVDSFTGTDGTELSTHTGEIGATWTAHPNSDIQAFINSNRITAGNSGTQSLYYASGTPGNDQYVQATIRVLSSLNVNAGIAARMQTSANTYYFLRYNPGTSAWELRRTLSGSATGLGSWSETLNVGDERTARLEIVGTTLKVYINGVQRISVTDSNILGGRVGFRFGGAASSSTGLGIDNFEAGNQQ